ncbi:MAG: MFS transporter [SAR202 cluster bacterium]|nr:MFS transporter [SAR202 cluster bacterium]
MKRISQWLGTSNGLLPVFSWGLFDFANTIFTVNVLNLYFYLWVVEDNGARDIYYSLALSGSMLAVALVSPMLGAVSDRYGRRIPFLIVFSLVCAAATGLIGRVGGLPVALLCFAVANFAYQSGNVYYDSLLSTVSHEGNRGRISGFGASLGYFGNIAGIGMVAVFVDQWGRGAAFLPTAALFLLFALPCFLLVREAGNGTAWNMRLLRDGYRQLGQTLRHARSNSRVFRFIAARFLYVDAAQTLFGVMAVYVTKVIGFADGQVRWLVITATVSAIAGAAIHGRLVDYIGPKKTLALALLLWMLVFLSAAVTAHKPAFWAIGALVGLAMGGTGAADRAFLLKLAPADRTGEFFGLYGLAGRFGSVVGPLVWGATLTLLADWGLLAYRVAILVLLVSIVLGFLVLLGVKEEAKAGLE